jgi:hypothetical protein
MPTKKVEFTDNSPVSLILGILSFVFGLFPLLGFGLGIAGLVTSINGMRRYEKTKDGNVYRSFKPWMRVTPVRKAGLIISALGMMIGAVVTIVGLISLALIVNSDINFS